MYQSRLVLREGKKEDCVLNCQSMYAAYAIQSILCYCSLPAASPEKLGYCAIKHEGLLD